MPLLSPAPTTATVSKVMATPPEFISPSTRRHVPVHQIASPTSCAISENPDDAERRARRRSRVLELQRQQLTSPGTPPGERSRSTPLSGLSNTQLADHYASCIKLSTENKINAKNAFGLHLIDYMSELIKKKEMNNFQVASSTLDASAKIYAGRVDAVHSETYKMLGGLGRGAEKQGGRGDNQEDMDLEGAEEASEAGDKKKKKRKRAGKTVETNLKNITVNNFNLEFEVDPLFQKTSASFDEGGTSGLLLNHLCCSDNTSQLVLDSETVLSGRGIDRLYSVEEQKLCSVKGFKGVLQAASLPSLEICPSFSDFTFTNWDKNSEDTLSSVLKNRRSVSKDQHAFDIDADVEPVPDPAMDQTYGGGGGMDDFGGAHDDDDNDDAASTYSETPSIAGDTESVVIGDTTEAKLVHNVMDSIKDGTVGELMQVLSTEPSDYSYFNTNLLSTWAGPSHWKAKGVVPKDMSAASTSGEKTAEKSKKKKAPFKIDYDQQTEMTQYFKQSKASTIISKTTLKRYTRSSITLPEDVHYPAEKLVKLFAKPKIKIRRTKPVTEDVDEGVENYDYENPNDRENFCPAAMDEAGGDDDDNDDGGGFDFTQQASEYDQSAFQDVTANLSEIPEEGGGDQTLLGDNLIAQPRKVAKIDIAYARTAKKMDVKRLKTAMWSLLVKREEQDKENEADNQQETSDAVNGAHNFSSLLSTLPETVSKNMAKNLSTAICFVCVLHLANEKTLKFEGQPDMSDFSIEQG